MPHNITKSQVETGVAMAIVKLLDKDKQGAAFKFEYSLDSGTTFLEVLHYGEKRSDKKKQCLLPIYAKTSHICMLRKGR